MTKLTEVCAHLNITMYVDCPNEDCSNYFDLLNESHTEGYAYNDDGRLLRQVFPKSGSHDDFECEEVTCPECETEFNVKGLEW